MIDATAIILAGGRSTRMGRDKRSLPWNGSSLLEQAINVACGIASEVLVVTDAAGRTHDVRVREVVDELTGIGPLGGLHAGLNASTHAACIVWACDAPFISVELLHELLLRLEDHLVAAPINAYGIQPLCAAWSTRALPYLIRFHANGGRSLRSLLKMLPDVLAIPATEITVPASEFDPFTSLNTPDEYRRACDELAAQTRQKQLDAEVRAPGSQRQPDARPESSPQP